VEKLIYLDNNATSEITEETWEAMLPYFRHQFGNPASIQHRLGRQAHAALDDARKKIAELLSVQPQEIFFNSGATESINTVLKGIFERYQLKGKHIITSPTEHKAVLNCCEYLQKKGAEISFLSVDKDGQINLEELKQRIRKDTILVCLMGANNETGLIHPIAAIAELCQAADTLFFCDATQLVAKQEINLQHIPIDILCLSAHKFHGPKGIGCLYVRRKSKPIQISPLISGGGQEQDFRGGTSNLPLIVGMAKAMELAYQHQGYNKQILALRNRFESLVIARIPEVEIISATANRLSNTSFIIFKHLLASEIISQIPQVAVSAGAACTAGSRAPSHVLLAQGYSEDQAKASIRFSFSQLNTEAEVEQVLDYLETAVQRLRAQSPIWQLFQAGIIR